MQDFYKELRSFKPEEIKEFSKWVTSFTKLKAKPFNFDKHEYQKTILDDTHPTIGVRKCVQVGVSEILIRKFLAFMAMHQGCQGIYTFPTAAEVSQFVKARVDPVIKGCSKIKELGFNTDNVKVKQIGQSFVHFKGSFGERETIAVPSDYNIHDEIDYSKPDIQNLYRSRLEHSSFRWETNCSTPSIPSYGIDQIFEDSDQRHWHIKCPHCNMWQILTWLPDKDKIDTNNIADPNGNPIYVDKENIKEIELIYVCRKCRKKLEYRSDLEMEWVAKYTNKDIHGYHLGPCVAWGYKKPSRIIKSFYDYKEIDKAYNHVLGLAYTDPGKKLTRDVIVKCWNNDLQMETTGRNCFMAADQGPPSWVIIGEYDNERDKVKILRIEKIDRNMFDQVDAVGTKIPGRFSELMGEFDVHSAVIDAQPNTESAYQFAKNYGGRAHICFYSDRQLNKLVWKPEEFVVVANRTRSIDYAMQFWLDKRVEIFPEDAINYQTYEALIKHLTSMVKVIDEDEHGQQKAMWKGHKNRTHFAHVWNYLCMAIESEINIVNRVTDPSITGFKMKA